MNRGTLRGHGSSILVAALSSSFGVALLHVVGVLTAVIREDRFTGGSDTIAVMLGMLAVVFLTIAVYVGAVVTSNTFATIVAGRARTIALLRLIGASARDQRTAIAREGLLVGAIGSGIGLVAGTAIAAALDAVAVRIGAIPASGYSWANPLLVVPVIAVVLTTWGASWVGSRRVLTVTPLQAVGGAQELTLEESRSRPGRNAVAIVLFAVGTGILLLGVALGLISPSGVLVGLAGGVLSFTGLVLGAHLVMPPALRLVGRMLGRSPSARLAAENALRYPERSSRTTIGVVIGVTLVTTFGVATASFAQLIRLSKAQSPGAYDHGFELLDQVQAVFSVLIGVSALIAAVGLVNNLSLSVLQRTRELGLLRALGFSVPQLRRMVLAESAQLTLTAVLVGLVLGGFYGWAGAQALLGSINGSAGVVLPAVPWTVIGVIVVASALLTWVASIAPSRRATAVSPVVALAVE